MGYILYVYGLVGLDATLTDGTFIDWSYGPPPTSSNQCIGYRWIIFTQYEWAARARQADLATIETRWKITILTTLAKPQSWYSLLIRRQLNHVWRFVNIWTMCRSKNVHMYTRKLHCQVIIWNAARPKPEKFCVALFFFFLILILYMYIRTLLLCMVGVQRRFTWEGDMTAVDSPR